MRYVLLDRVVEVEPGRRIEALKAFPLSDECYRNAFYFTPCVPYGLLVEVMAQAGGVLLSCDSAEAPAGLVFAKIEKVRFSGPVLPGCSLVVRAEVLDPSPGAVRLGAELSHDGRVLAEMTFFLARREVDDSTDFVDRSAFDRGQQERAAVIGVPRFVGGVSPGNGNGGDSG